MDHDNDNDIPLANLLDSGLIILSSDHQPAWSAGDGYTDDLMTDYWAASGF